MARPKEVYGKKLIYRYSAGLIFYILFSLMVIAIYALAFFLPLIKIPGATEGLTGVSFVQGYIDLFTNTQNLAFTIFRNHITQNVFDNNGIANAIVNVTLYVIGGVLAVMGIYVVILVIGTLVMIFSGRLKHWKLPYSMTKRIFIWSFLYYGVVIGLNIYAAIMNKPTYDCLLSYIFFGGLFVLTIVLHIIWGVCFKKHVYVKNEETLKRYMDEYEKANVVTDTSKVNKEPEVIITEAPKPVKPIEPLDANAPKNDSSDNRKYLPRGIKNIGGHAFSQNTALEIADIPLGIEVLGPGAFANCVNLREVHIPESIKKIDYNCFFNCIRLKRITYGGSREMWKKIKRGSNWLASAGTRFVVCIDGALTVNPEK